MTCHFNTTCLLKSTTGSIILQKTFFFSQLLPCIKMNDYEITIVVLLHFFPSPFTVVQKIRNAPALSCFTFVEGIVLLVSASISLSNSMRAAVVS